MSRSSTSTARRSPTANSRPPQLDTLPSSVGSPASDTSRGSVSRHRILRSRAVALPARARPRRCRGGPPEPQATPLPRQDRHHRRLRCSAAAPRRVRRYRTENAQRRDRIRPRATRGTQQRGQNRHRRTQRAARPDHDQPGNATQSAARPGSRSTAGHLHRIQARPRPPRRSTAGDQAGVALTRRTGQPGTRASRPARTTLASTARAGRSENPEHLRTRP